MAAVAQAPEHQFDRHADAYLALHNIGHLAEKPPAAFQVNDGHYRWLNGRIVQIILRKRKHHARTRQRHFTQRLRIPAPNADARNRKLDGAAFRAPGAMEPDVLAFLFFPEDIRDFGPAGVLSQKLA
jgi:hypothetical protein